MDYWTLVNMLLGHITPEIRKHILERLTELNNGLLYGSSMIPIIPPDITRPGIINPRKKDMEESIQPNMYKYNTPMSKEIDLDDIIDDIQNEPDTLDIKLAKIKTLRDKIIADKRQRRRAAEFKK